jgi:plasmid maintenance system antidote protein VapI
LGRSQQIGILKGSKAHIRAGEILLEEYLVPMGFSQNAMARAVAKKRRTLVKNITPATKLLAA